MTHALTASDRARDRGACGSCAGTGGTGRRPCSMCGGDGTAASEALTIEADALTAERTLVPAWRW